MLGVENSRVGRAERCRRRKTEGRSRRGCPSWKTSSTRIQRSTGPSELKDSQVKTWPLAFNAFRRERARVQEAPQLRLYVRTRDYENHKSLCARRTHGFHSCNVRLD